MTPSLTSREKRHPKVVITDTGLACALLGRNADGLGVATSSLTGPLLESFVTMDVVKQLGWSDRQPTIRHWRDRNGAAVDLILEDADGTISGVEVKAAPAVGLGDVKQLHGLRDKVGDRFSAGGRAHLGPAGDDAVG